MDTSFIARHIAQQLGLSAEAVANTLALLDEGCTIPFISRYRKERTGALDEVQIAAISEASQELRELIKRKETVVKTITAQQKMTPQLQQRIDDCWDATQLEDIYQPFKPRRHTRAQVARQQGLEPLAQLILLQTEPSLERAVRPFLVGDVKTEADALKGAQDIIAEMVSDDERSRQQLRGAYRRTAIITSRVVKARQADDQAAKFSDYFDWHEPLRRCSSHRLLAMRRGEAEGILRLSIAPADDQECIDRLKRQWVRPSRSSRPSQSAQLVAEAVDDAYKRLLKPSIETEFYNQSKADADAEAIRVFATNLRQLLLGAPLGPRRVMAIDPGFRTGCKVVCLDQQGSLLHHEAIFPHPPVNRRMQAMVHVQQMLNDYQIEAVAIGNGTASRETKEFIRDLLPPSVALYIVSEDGASVYSASPVARQEFPDQDVTVRGAVSIGRRLMDPLAELVKIDPKSIGVGQYQHDVDQAKLKQQLDQTVVSCVNLVGVNVNTASSHLLQYVSGLGPALAQNIVDYRRQHGPFTSRSQLTRVPRLGPAAFQQCAAFLRIPGSANPLDNSAVHPERYALVERMAADQHCTVPALMAQKELRARVDISHYVTPQVGLPTLTDIMAELEKPGRDPRQQLEAFEFSSQVHTIDDLEPGMVLPGIVTNITNFGAFVDIGVHHDGLVHISQMANRRIAHPSEVVTLHQHVSVKVVDVDHRRNRIALSIKQVE